MAILITAHMAHLPLAAGEPWTVAVQYCSTLPSPCSIKSPTDDNPNRDVGSMSGYVVGLRLRAKDMHWIWNPSMVDDWSTHVPYNDGVLREVRTSRDTLGVYLTCATKSFEICRYHKIPITMYI